MIKLAGDIGGTNTRLVLAEVNDAGFELLLEKTFPSNDFNSFEAVLEQFLAEAGKHQQADSACFAVAGPVIAGRSNITNLPWTISETTLQQRFNFPALKLLNDFTALAHGISYLQETDIQLVQGGEVKPACKHPSSMVIGAGTGLGVAHRTWLNDRYHVFPSEAGHVNFAPSNSLERSLLAWLQNDDKHVSLENILSGSGLYLIYQFLLSTGQYSQAPGLEDNLPLNDPAQVITTNALQNKDSLSVATLDLFIAIYGSAVGDAALHYYPLDEIYIAGGIAPKIKDKICNRLFTMALSNKGAMSANLAKIPVKLVLNEKVGLIGALHFNAH